jgi:hypothetical protein
MISPIMDRSLELSRIRRLDEMTQAADNWLKEESRSKITAGQLFEPGKTVSFFSTTAFKECHQVDRIEIENAVAKSLSKPRQKKQLTVLFLVHVHDAITKAANKQRKSLATVAIQQISGRQWNTRLKTIPSSILIRGIVPFLQHPVENPPALSYVFDLCEHNGTDAFAEAYIGSRSRAAARFQALKTLTVSPKFVNDKADILLRQVLKTLTNLARTGDTPPSCFALCSTDNARLIGLLQKSSSEGLKTFVELNRASIGSNNGLYFYETWLEVYKTKGTPNLTQDQERRLTGTIIPVIHLFKEMQKMKNELAFRYSPDLLAESQTIAKLPESIFLRSLVPYLSERALKSLKGVNRAFNHILPTPLCTRVGSGSIHSLTAFFEKYRVTPFDLEKEKAHATEFLETFEALTLKDQRTFRKLLWLVGGHKVANAKDETFSDQILGKKSHSLGDRSYLTQAYSMMFSLGILKDLVDRFDRNGLDDAAMATIIQDYQKMPRYVRTRVNNLACIFTYGNMFPTPGGSGYFVSSGFEKRGVNAKAFALACRLLAEGNFKLLARDARSELLCLSRTLKDCASHLDHVTVRSAYTYYIKHPKAKNLLIKAVEILVNCPGEGQTYMQGTASDKAGYPKPFDAVLFANLVYALAHFERS